MLPLKIVRENDKKHEEMMQFYMRELKVKERSEVKRAMELSTDEKLKELWGKYSGI